MGTNIFSGCSKLEKVHLPNTCQIIPEGTFKNCTSLKEVNFPDTLTAIRKNAFYNCDALTAVTLPEGVTMVEGYAFYDCDALTSVTIPDTTTSLGTYAFAYSELLKDVKLGAGLTKIPDYAFYECPALTEMVLPYRITTVGTKAFANCTNFAKITIPRATTSISADAFSYPAKMTIYGVAGTYAETYAGEQGIAFVNEEVNATAVTLNQETLTINKGETFQLVMSVTPENFTDVVTWRSSNEEAVTITSDGTLTAKGVGTATVRVTVGSVSASCKVTVLQPVTSIYLNKSSAGLDAFDTVKLTATVYPSNAADPSVAWSSDNEAVATVDSEGLVTAVSKGTATITVAAQDGSGITKTCKVTVNNNGHLCTTVGELESPHNYEINCTDIWIYRVPGKTSLTVTFDERTEMEEDFDYLHIYDGMDNLVGSYTGMELAGQSVEVNGNTLKLQMDSDEAGTAWGFKVSDVTYDGQKKATSVKLDKTTAELYANDTLQLTATMLPADTTDVISWSSDNEAVITVDTNGLVTAVGLGSAVIRASANGNAYADCTISVVPTPVYTVSFDTGCDIVIADVLVEKGRTVAEPTALMEREGYEFAGWYAEGRKYDFAAPVTGSLTLTAKWNREIVEPENPMEGVLPGDVPEDGIIPDGLWIAGLDREGYEYTGKAIKPQIRVYDHEVLLTEKTDYTVAYKNNTKANDGSVAKTAPTITVTGKGNYKDKTAVTFKITPMDISGAGFAADDMAVLYRAGKEQKPVPVLTLNGKKLRNKTDYTVSYPETAEGAYINPGTYPVMITGVGNYTGERTVNLTITKGVLMSKVKVNSIPSQPYTGGEIEPEIILKNGSAVVDKSLYTVEYVNNTEIGTATVILTGNGTDYVGVKRVTFKITGISLSKAKVEGLEKSFTYTGEPVTQDNFTVTYTDKKSGTVTLEEGKDYKVSYLKNVNAGSATLVLEGMGGYTGTVKKVFKLNPYNIKEDAEGKFEVLYDEEVFHAKGGSIPYVEVRFDGELLTPKKDYTISFKNNKEVTTSETKRLPVIEIRGKGNFAGTRNTETFTILEKDIAEVSIVVADKAYTGKAGGYKSVPKIYDTDGKLMGAGKDYEKTIRYYYAEEICLADGSKKSAGEEIGAKDIVPIGTLIMVEITGKGNYSATTATEIYRIIDKTKDISRARVTIKAQTYTGRAVEPDKEDITVVLNGVTLSPDDYEITGYKNNIKKGNGTVTLHGVGEYGGTKNQNFTIGQKLFHFLFR